MLASSPGRVYSNEQIYDIVWQEPYSGDYNIVMNHIHHIREKIEDNPSKPPFFMVQNNPEIFKKKFRYWGYSILWDVCMSEDRLPQ